MKNKFVVMNGKDKLFYRSELKVQLSPPWSAIHSYVSASGEVDTQSFNNDIKDLISSGFCEVVNPNRLQIELVYLKPSGQYYASGILIINKSEANSNPERSYSDVVDCVKDLLVKKELPGLATGASFDTYISGNDHPGGYPVLLKCGD